MIDFPHYESPPHRVRPSVNVSGSPEALDWVHRLLPPCTRHSPPNSIFSRQPLNRFPSFKRRWIRLDNTFLTIYNTRYDSASKCPPQRVNKDPATSVSPRTVHGFARKYHRWDRMNEYYSIIVVRRHLERA